jgi:putative aldouronate transport system permease protein
MAIAFVAILPIMLIFPFFQKYYSKGLTLGGVKG